MIKNVIFDMGNTLVDFSARRIVETFFEGEDIDAVFKAVFGSSLWALADTGAIDENTIVRMIKKNIPERLYPRLDDMMANWYKTMLPLDYMTSLVKDLKEKGYKIYLLSNTNMRFFEYKDKFETLTLLDGYVISADCILCKPDPRIFVHLINKFSLKPEECYFVDDGETNVECANDFGIKGFCFRDYDISGLKEDMRKNGINV